jgi:hypothetical protein
MANMRSRLKSGNALSRVRNALSQSHRMHQLPPRENPLGIPRSVMKQIQDERLSDDPAALNRLLQKLMVPYRLSDGKG